MNNNLRMYSDYLF